MNHVHVNNANHRALEGFTLIEVVSSLVMIGLTVVSILSMFSLGERSRALNKQSLQALNLLQMKMEETLSKDFVNINNGITVYPGFSNYTLSVTTITPYNSNPFLKSVVISIDWITPFNKVKSESVSTLVVNN